MLFAFSQCFVLFKVLQFSSFSSIHYHDDCDRRRTENYSTNRKRRLRAHRRWARTGCWSQQSTILETRICPIILRLCILHGDVICSRPLEKNCARVARHWSDCLQSKVASFPVRTTLFETPSHSVSIQSSLSASSSEPSSLPAFRSLWGSGFLWMPPQLCNSFLVQTLPRFPRAGNSRKLLDSLVFRILSGPQCCSSPSSSTRWFSWRCQLYRVRSEVWASLLPRYRTGECREIFLLLTNKTVFQYADYMDFCSPRSGMAIVFYNHTWCDLREIPWKIPSFLQVCKILRWSRTFLIDFTAGNPRIYFRSFEGAGRVVGRREAAYKVWTRQEPKIRSSELYRF